MWHEVIKDGVKGSPDGCNVQVFKKGDVVPESLVDSFMRQEYAKENEGEPPVIEAEVSEIDTNGILTKEELAALTDKFEEFEEISANFKKILSSAGVNGHTLNALIGGTLAPERINEVIADFSELKTGRNACELLLIAFGLTKESVDQIILGTFEPEALTAKITEINNKRDEAIKLEEARVKALQLSKGGQDVAETSKTSGTSPTPPPNK